jgi:7-cyano-7-deazaguanine synthase in queuosine biosynthesis
MNILVNFSGGVDSTLVALRALNTSHKITLHHMVLKNKMNRWKPELKAVQNLVVLFKEKYQFEYLETTLDTIDIPMTYDSLHTTQMATAICFSRKGNISRRISEVHMGFIKDDDLASFGYRTVLEAPFKSDPPELILPLIETTKKEILKELPAEYLEHCFWCRRPKPNGDPCGFCHACKLYKKASV